MAESIQIVQPHYGDGPEAEQFVANFWSVLADDPLAVVIVEPVFREGDGLAMEVCEVSAFSCLDKALDHAKALRCYGAVIIPKWIDEPSWGNVSVN